MNVRYLHYICLTTQVLPAAHKIIGHAFLPLLTPDHVSETAPERRAKDAKITGVLQGRIDKMFRGIGPPNRGAKGYWLWRGVSPPQPTTGSGERRESPSGMAGNTF